MSGNLSLPLFPLNTVLFPGQVLPLHIFEQRYRDMIEQCIDARAPFGVVLIQEGDEVGEPAKPYHVGTTARITQVERLDDGRLNIISVGELRFRVVSLYQEHAGYLRAEVDLWPWSPSDTDVAQSLAQNVRGRLRRYVEMLSQASGVDLQAEELPQQPTELACLTAIALQVTQFEKQELLGSPSIASLLSKEISLLRRELRMLHVMLASRGRPTSDDIPLIFSVN
jgi:Lon protease-like protein